MLLLFSQVLYSKIEQKEFESKSQLNFSLLPLCLCCIQRSNKKNLKANHNSFHEFAPCFVLYSKIEQKEFESKSQPMQQQRSQIPRCIQRSNKKNLKANHNNALDVTGVNKLYSKIEQKEFESKSQRAQTDANYLRGCIQRSNKKNLKANHNRFNI